jgi:hypothetical protein
LTVVVIVVVGACRAECDGDDCKRRGDHATAEQVSPVEQAARPRISRRPAARRSFDTHPESSLANWYEFALYSALRYYGARSARGNEPKV